MVGIRSFFWNLKEQTYLVLPFHKSKSTELTDQNKTYSHDQYLDPRSIFYFILFEIVGYKCFLTD